jgi:hypothetical protein
MRKIHFNPELIGKPGIEVRVDGEVPDFIKWYPSREKSVKGYFKSGYGFVLDINSNYLTMYRQTRSAEEIAKEVYQEISRDTCWLTWEQSMGSFKDLYTALVQNGMDEVTDKNE